MLKYLFVPKHTLLGVGFLVCLLCEIIFVSLRVSFWSFPVFLVVFFLIVYIPGRLLIRWLKLSCSPLERFTLELGSGYVGTTLVYFILRAINLELIYFFLIAFTTAYYFYGLTCNEEPWPAIELKIDRFSIWFLVVFLLVIGNVGWLNFPTWVFNADGSLTLDTLIDRDSIFHVSMAQEMADTFFPRHPFAGNFKLAYHFFPDLFAAIFVRWAYLAPWDLVARYLPIFLFTLLFLAFFILVRKLTKDSWLALFAVFLLNFMGNMGFIHKILGYQLYHPYWEGYFTHHLMMLHMNPLQVATTLIILAFFCLACYWESNQLSWFILTVVFLGLLTFYKAIVAMQVLIGLVIPALILALKKRDFRLIYLGLISGVIAVISAYVIWINSSYSGKIIAFKPWFLVFYSFALTLSENEQFYFAYAKFYRLMFKVGLGSFLRYCVGYGLFFLVGSLWLRLIGLKKWFNDLVNITRSPVEAFIAYTILVGIVITMLFNIPAEPYYIVFLIDLSVYLLSYYAAVGLFSLLSPQKRIIQWTFVVLFIAMSLPTTINFIGFGPKSALGHIPPRFVRLTNYLKTNVSPGVIVAHPFEAINYLLLPPLGRVRTMAEQVFPIENLLGPKTTYQLRMANLRIYRTTDPAELKRILFTHNVDYVVEDEQTRIKAAKNDIMTTVYSADGYVLNRVLRMPEL